MEPPKHAKFKVWYIANPDLDKCWFPNWLHWLHMQGMWMMFMLELPVQRTWQLTVAKDFNKAGKRGFVKLRAVTSGPIVENQTFSTPKCFAMHVWPCLICFTSLSICYCKIWKNFLPMFEPSIKRNEVYVIFCPVLVSFGKYVFSTYRTCTATVPRKRAVFRP